MAESDKPLLIKRYASRRLYNTETSDYVTLDDIARFIREGREVKIVDLKSGDDLTRQYLLQIIAEHESRGESVLPLGVLTDLVRSYTTQAQSVVPQFLAMSFDMLRDGQSKMVENMGSINPLASMPGMAGLEAMQAQQQAFLKAMTGGWAGGTMPGGGPGAGADAGAGSGAGQGAGQGAGKSAGQGAGSDDLDEIKKQLADLQSRLSRMGN